MIFLCPDSPVVRSNRFADSVCKSFDILWKNKEDEDNGQLLLESLDNLAKERNRLHNKINQLLASL